MLIQNSIYSESIVPRSGSRWLKRISMLPFVCSLTRARLTSRGPYIFIASISITMALFASCKAHANLTAACTEPRVDVKAAVNDLIDDRVPIAGN